MKMNQLMAKRTAAGADYVTALDALRAAYVELAALDRTLTNRHVGGVDIRSFRHHRLMLSDALRSFEHAEFANRLVVNEWADPIVAISDQQILQFEGDF